MKFFPTPLIRQLDQYTIEHEPIASVELMERAAEALYREIISSFPELQSLCVLAGQGNNGGDALALARMMLNTGYDVSVFLVHTNRLSPDCEKNKARLLAEYPHALTEITEVFVEPTTSSETILVDGIFGSGLSRPTEGIFAQAIEWINRSKCRVVSIDIPSGLQGEENSATAGFPIVKASLTLSLQFPKLAFLLPENEAFVGRWKVLGIGIHPRAIEETPSNLYFTEKEDTTHLLKKRLKFSHKGRHGHGCIISGSRGMGGASVLASKAALRSGAGLVTVHGPECNRVIVQTAVPEIIFQPDAHSYYNTAAPQSAKYSAMAIGPGIGTHPDTAKMLRELLQETGKPCVLDADALNMLAMENDLLELIPKNSILTPHPKEFDRVFGHSPTSFHRLMKAQEAAIRYGVIIVLKGAYTCIALPDATLHFNSTGNPGMATAGSGDVLTGILCGLLAQGYTPIAAAKLGVFLHGLAGDLALEKESEESLIAGDIIENIGRAYDFIKG